MYKRLVQKVDKDSFLKRCDDNHIFFYHKASDYKGLKDDKYEFKTEDGTTLRGHFYYYPNYNKKELIIFCHGFGGGHRSYLDYINFFCLNGYRVLAYDYKGTFESDGENLGGFSEPIVDLLALLNTLKKEGYFDKYKVSCIGHSWGGFAIGNALNYFDGINKAIIVSGPTSFADYLEGSIPNKLPFKNKAIEEFLRVEKINYPKYYNSTAITGYLKTSTKVLLVQSQDDKIVNFNYSSLKVKNAIGEKDNIKYYFINHHNHMPLTSVDSCIYYEKTFDGYYKLLKKHKLKTIGEKKAYFKNTDWDKMTELDYTTMNLILDFIKN